MADIGISTTAGGTRIMSAAYDTVIDAVRITGRGVDALVLNDALNDALTIREGARRIRSILMPRPRTPTRLELVDPASNCQAGC